MNWLEISAHRVLEVERNELMNEFEMYDEAGTKLCGNGRVYFLFRKRDGRRFKFAQFGDLHAAVEQKRIFLRKI
jgi:hypothetical protein